MQETWVGSLGQKDPPEKGMALQYSCLEDPMDREARRGGGTLHRVTKNRTGLST